VPALAFCGDDGPALQKILERLDHLEQQNQQLTEEVRMLRAELAAKAAVAQPAAADPPTVTPSLAEKVDVQEQRTDELAQVKVESSQRFPIRITGMALFNSFINSRNNGGSEYPGLASRYPWPATSGASVSQTEFGLEFHGPETFGAKVSGSVQADFFGADAGGFGQEVRLRTANVNLDWRNQSVVVGVDRPLISLRSPSSLAEVGYPALWASGNLWLWQPQVRVEQRFSLGDSSGFRAQGSIYETNEISYQAPGTDTNVEQARPGYEGRFEYWSHPSSGASYEVAGGFHLSTSHAAGFSVPSHVYVADWLISPWPKLVWTGMFFHGENLGGLGGIGPGFSTRTDTDGAGQEYLIPVHAIGGWTQLSLLATKRLTFNAYAGQQANRASDLNSGDINRNLGYAANAVYRIAPNVLVSFEALQYRTSYLNQATRLQNRYDLALAYLF
jgi:hypothetical protein